MVIHAGGKKEGATGGKEGRGKEQFYQNLGAGVEF